MNEQERKIIEKRTILATKNGLMGFAGKLGTILKYLGEPIITHNTNALWDENYGGYSSQTLDQYLGYPMNNDDYDDSEMDTMDDHDALGNSINEPTSAEWNSNKKPRKQVNTEITGWYFQSLSNGFNLEIKYTEDTKEIICNYKGYLVYKEFGGELKAYVPNDEWEQKVNDLFKIARKREDKDRKKEREIDIQKEKKKKSNWMNDMIKFWGI